MKESSAFYRSITFEAFSKMVILLSYHRLNIVRKCRIDCQNLQIYVLIELVFQQSVKSNYVCKCTTNWDLGITLQTSARQQRKIYRLYYSVTGIRRILFQDVYPRSICFFQNKPNISHLSFLPLVLVKQLNYI